MTQQQWIRKDIPVEPAPPVKCTFTYDGPYTDKFGNNKWQTTDGQYVQASPTLLKMCEHLGIKANMPVDIGKRVGPDGKTHFTVNGQTATELFGGQPGGTPPPAAPMAQPTPQPQLQSTPAPAPIAPGAVGTSQPSTNAGLNEAKVHLESALKIVNELIGDDLPF